MLVASWWLVGDISAASFEADHSGAHRLHSSTSVQHGADRMWDWSSCDPSGRVLLVFGVAVSAAPAFGSVRRDERGVAAGAASGDSRERAAAPVAEAATVGTGGATPHADRFASIEGVLEAGFAHRAGRTDRQGDRRSCGRGVPGREEQRGVAVAACSSSVPGVEVLSMVAAFGADLEGGAFVERVRAAALSA